MTAWGAVLSFILDGDFEEEVKDKVYCLGEDLYYSEFVDYTVLEDFLEDFKSGRIDISDLNDWQKAIFERDFINYGPFVKRCQESYTTMSPEELANKIREEEEFEDQNELLESYIQTIYEEIDNQPGQTKLDL